MIEDEDRAADDRAAAGSERQLQQRGAGPDRCGGAADRRPDRPADGTESVRKIAAGGRHLTLTPLRSRHTSQTGVAGRLERT